MDSEELENLLKGVWSEGKVSPPTHLIHDGYMVYIPGKERIFSIDYEETIKSHCLPKGTKVRVERVIEFINYEVK